MTAVPLMLNAIQLAVVNLAHALIINTVTVQLQTAKS
jgi:hypothetical protein